MLQKQLAPKINYIHVYTRKDALADGTLINVTMMAKEAGFKIPVAVTSALWFGYIVPSTVDSQSGQDKDGRLWDVLSMLFIAIKFSRTPGSELTYSLIFEMEGRPKLVTLKGIIGPGDAGEPVLTISLSEDQKSND